MAVITIVSRSALSTIVALLLWSVLPGLVGFQTTTVMSGSMAPRLAVGDAIVVRHLDAAGLAEGHVLLFDDPDHPGRLRMHRLVSVRPDGQLVTKGDANQDRDSSTVGFDAVHGAAFLRIPYAGLPNYWLKTNQPLPLLGGGVLVLLLMSGVRLRRLLDDNEAQRRRRHRGVRLRGAHRAVTAGAVLMVLSGQLISPTSGASAAYSGTAANGRNDWKTMCGDVTPSNVGTGPQLYWGFGTVSGTTQKIVADLSAQNNAGWLLGDAARVDCDGGFSPALAVGSGSGGATAEQTSRALPGTLTVATWFKTTSTAPNTGGGVLADFGSSKSIASSTAANFALYMLKDGRLSFGGATIQVSSLVVATPVLCTTPSGYLDGKWHLAVATWGNSAGCTLTVDGGVPAGAGSYAPQSSNAPSSTVGLLGYPGYWRFGADKLSTLLGWTGYVSDQFVGTLDEMQTYPSVLGASARRSIFERAH